MIDWWRQNKTWTKKRVFSTEVFWVYSKAIVEWIGIQHWPYTRSFDVTTMSRLKRTVCVCGLSIRCLSTWLNVSLQSAPGPVTNAATKPVTAPAASADMTSATYKFNYTFREQNVIHVCILYISRKIWHSFLHNQFSSDNILVYAFLTKF